MKTQCTTEEWYDHFRKAVPSPRRDRHLFELRQRTLCVKTPQASKATTERMHACG